MRTPIEELFEHLNQGRLGELWSNLTDELVNTRRLSTLYDVDYSYDARLPTRGIEKQYELLLFEAMRRKSYEGFQMLLDAGADLFLKEYFDITEHVIIRGVLKPQRRVMETNVALTCISESEDIQFIQRTFNHICIRQLYVHSDCINFLVDHLDKVDRTHFKREYLRIDVGNDLPPRFETTEEYKEYLEEQGVDLTGFFFYPAEYLAYLINPSNIIDAEFLRHALNVCKFSFEEVQTIYGALQDEALKDVVESHTPEVSPEYRAALSQAGKEAERVAEEERVERAAANKKRAQEQALRPPKISEADRKEFAWFPKRIEFLTNQIARLEEQKQTGKVKKDLKSARESLSDCKARFFNHPLFEGEKKQKVPELAQEREESPEFELSFSLSSGEPGD